MVLGSSEMVLLLLVSLLLLLLLLLFESCISLLYGFKFLCEMRGFFKEFEFGGDIVDDNTDDPDEENLSGTI